MYITEKNVTIWKRKKVVIKFRVMIKVRVMVEVRFRLHFFLRYFSCKQ